jgi:hypothetical protein
MGTALAKSRRRAQRSVARHVVLAAIAAIAASGCLYDADDRCGSNQIVYQDVRCVCAEGSAWTADGCVACAENEQPSANGCECIAGFGRATPDSACEAAPSGLGVACDSASACTDSVYDHCQLAGGTSGYCTNSGCTSSDQCQGGYACDTRSATPFCRRPPVGLGQPCESAADCAGTEATWCETFMTHQCIVQGCSLADQDCFGDQQCCDFSQFGVPAPVCVPAGGC